MENNIFKNAYFGKAYKTRDGRKAIYRIYCLTHHLFTKTDVFQCNDEGYVTRSIVPVSNLDIVSEWQEEMDEEELGKLANEYISNYSCEDYDGVDEQKQIDTKKLLQLVEYVYELLKLNENPEDIYPILSWMCRNGYFTNFEFKDEDIFINGKQITKDGLLIILNNE